MKWGKKKLHSSASSSFYSSSSSPLSSSIPHCSRPPSLISHVFPNSWLSKFKHKNTSKSEPKPTKLNPKESTKFNSPYDNARGKFYYASEEDSDAFWRLSFGQDCVGEKSKKTALKPPIWNGDETIEEPSSSSCSNCGGRSEARKNKREKERVLISPRRAQSSRKSKRSTYSYKLDHLTEEEDYFSDDRMSFDLLSLRELEAESEERKSLYVSMEKHRKRNGNRVKVCSPRTAKIKAFEDMKKASPKKRMKNKKKKERRVESKTGLDSYAVVKSSHDPEKDFKDSMAEMISEKKMSKPCELEELLACYLTLNSDENHGLIIKAFREVWLELADLKKQVSSD